MGRAILMLIDEIEALHVDLWNATTLGAREDGATADEAVEPASLERTLGARLRRLRRGSKENGIEPLSTDHSHPVDTDLDA
jgi:hypothetical protein